MSDGRLHVIVDYLAWQFRDLKRHGVTAVGRKLKTALRLCRNACVAAVARARECHLRRGAWGCLTGLLRGGGHGCVVILRALSDLLFLATAVILHGIKGLVCVRCGSLRSERIGHFCSNTEVWLSEKDAGMHGRRTLDLFYYSRPVCNQALKTMWDRVLRVSPVFERLDEAFLALGWESAHHIDLVDSATGRDVHGLLEDTDQHIHFSQDEEQRGQQWLRSVGVREGMPFVCLNARDSAFLDKALNPQGKWSWDYHNYRDSDIATYVKAAEALADMGYHVFRMGAIVKEPLRSQHPRIFDYATSGQRTEFLDLYLGARCHFFISTGTGLDSVPMIFRRPVCYVNYIPLGIVPTWGARNITILKTLYSKSLGRPLRFDEVIESGADKYFRAKQYEEAGLDIIPNTPEEICDVVLEMEARLAGTWVSSQEDDELQRCFWSLFKPCDLHRVFQARVGAQFLRTYRYLLPRQDCCGGGGCA